MNDKAFSTLGARIAGLEFDKRSKGRPYRTTEAHLRETELAALIALGVEEGYRRCQAESRREPVPEGVMTARGRLVALAPKPGAAPFPAYQVGDRRSFKGQMHEVTETGHLPADDGERRS